MAERVNPTKAERLGYYYAGQKGAEFLIDTIQRTRPVGQLARVGHETFSQLASNQRKKAALDLLRLFHEAVPLVALQLIDPIVRDDIANPDHDVRLRSLPGSVLPDTVGDMMSIMATGTNRIVSTYVSDIRVEISPDLDPAAAREKVRWADAGNLSV